METEEAMRQWIDGATYEQLLGHWRFAAVGDRYFRSDLYEGRVVEYYKTRMGEKKAALGHPGAVSASKSLGW